MAGREECGTGGWGGDWRGKNFETMADGRSGRVEGEGVGWGGRFLLPVEEGWPKGRKGGMSANSEPAVPLIRPVGHLLPAGRRETQLTLLR